MGIRRGRVETGIWIGRDKDGKRGVMPKSCNYVR